MLRKGIVLAAALGLALAGASAQAATTHKEPKDVHWSFEGPFGKFDQAQLQRGYKVYREVCATCHSMNLVSFRNLAQPGADLRKSIRRLALWGLIAQPLHALAFGSWLPLNILLTFTLAVVAVHAFANNRPVLLLLAAGVLPMFVDYQWAGVGAVLLAWIAFRHRAWWLLLVGLAAVCGVN
ncbi:TraX family protein, partial [Staphylococcus aureus]|nr:TraX family protein [Staphylococcus aureus]